MAPIYQLIQDRTGPGETGETVLGKRIGQEALFINPPRHAPDAALNLKIVIGADRALPMQKALQGENGSGLSVDYRGMEILAAWRYLPLHDWGMVAKMNKEEAFASISRLKVLTIYIEIFTLGLVVIAAMLMADSIAKPILTFTGLKSSNCLQVLKRSERFKKAEPLKGPKWK